ncbi:MAG TPA: cupin domain-containing protein [Thermoanaerobaculia bacterium]|nr:cupin domain-containing protein [Thermoanaerobaculia bacterium]
MRALVTILAPAVAASLLCAGLAFAAPHQTSAEPAAGATATYPPGTVEDVRPSNLTIDQIRADGAIGNLNQGIEIETHGLPTRLVAWPGIGALNGGIHVITLAPGADSGMYSYPVSEEAVIALQGSGEVFLHGKWVRIEAGDVAYFPEKVEHGMRNPKGSTKDFVVVVQLTPAHLDLYQFGGFYDRASGTFDYDAIDAAEKKAKPGTLPAASEIHFSDAHPELRAWNLSNEEIRSKGALFNLFKGAKFTGIGVPMRIILFPGFGTRNAGLHTGYIPAGGAADIHTHPFSDDIIVTVAGSLVVYNAGKAYTINALDTTIAPALAKHGAGGTSPKPALMFGFGAPPQPDLYMRTPYYQHGQYIRPEFELLEVPAIE